MSETNFITPNGLQRIQYEMQWLSRVERPRIVEEVSVAAEMGDRSENAEYIYGKKRLREIDSRLGYLMKCLNKIKAIDPGTQEGDRIRFGATVVVEDEDGVQKTYCIFGEHEVDVANGIISHKSPLALALMGKVEGDGIHFRTPGGERELEIVSVSYHAQTPLPVPDWKQGELP